MAHAENARAKSVTKKMLQSVRNWFQPRPFVDAECAKSVAKKSEEFVAKGLEVQQKN